jgi:lysophospholipase L1-like esterase
MNNKYLTVKECPATKWLYLNNRGCNPRRTMRNILSILVLILVVGGCTESGKKTFIPADNPNIAYIGRFDKSDPQKPVFMYSGCIVRTVFKGTSIALVMKDDSLRNWFNVIIDDSLFVIKADHKDSIYQLASGLKNKKHTLEIVRRSEWHGGNTTILGFYLDHCKKLFKPEVSNHRIEFIGDSYTCGYGNEGKSREEHFNYETENAYLAFGPLTAREVRAEYQLVSRSGIGMTQGYGGGKSFNMPRLYDEVTMDSTKRWDYSQSQPQLVMIDLGANDLSAPLDSATFVDAYIKFLGRIRNNYNAAKIVCLVGPFSPDEKTHTWQHYVHAVVNSFSIKDNQVYYFEFSPIELNGSDWHPNVAEDQALSAELVPYVKNLMKW